MKLEKSLSQHSQQYKFIAEDLTELRMLDNLAELGKTINVSFASSGCVTISAVTQNVPLATTIAPKVTQGRRTYRCKFVAGEWRCGYCMFVANPNAGVIGKSNLGKLHQKCTTCGARTPAAVASSKRAQALWDARKGKVTPPEPSR